jgi:hypothetical protein
MLQKWEMDLYHKHITELSDAELDKEYESCKNGQLDDLWYIAACYAELAKRKISRKLEWQKR